MFSMKYAIFLILFIMLACNGQPLVAPATPQTAWIDSDTRSDTIITNVDNFYTVIYYASKDWQESADTDLSHGYRLVAIRYGDTIYVKPADDPSTDYDGPFLLKINEDNNTLTAQNFLDTANANPARVFIRGH